MQRAATGAIVLERVGLAAAAIQREHQLAPAAARGCGCSRDERLELADDARVAAEREVGVDAVLERGEPRVLEARAISVWAKGS